MPAINGNGLQVLVVDDSAMVRQVMQAIMSTDRRITVKAAADPLIAWGKMEKEPPHVVITDLEMPRMDGLTFIRKIMSEMPTPVVVCSGLAARGTELALRALEEGAVEVITKPKVGSPPDGRCGTPAQEQTAMFYGAQHSDCRRCVNRRNGSLASLSGGTTHRLPAGRDCAAYAGRLYASVCGTPE